MTDITLAPISSGYSLSPINDNFETLKSVINSQVVHTTGGNNIMLQDLDMNGYHIINAQTNPGDPGAAVTQAQLDAEEAARIASDAAIRAEFQASVGGTANLNIATFSGTGAQNSFVLPYSPKVESATQVYINGVYQQKSEYDLTGVNLDTITFITAPPLGTNNIEVVALQVNAMGATDAALTTYTPNGGAQTTTKAWLDSSRIVTGTSAPLDTSPTVLNLGALYLNNGGATSITTLDDGVSNQQVELIGQAANSTLVHGAGFTLKGAVNAVIPVNGILTVRKVSFTAAWVEVSRNF
jgi:hypothetical protein